MKKGWKKMKLNEVCAFDKVQGIHRGLPHDLQEETQRLAFLYERKLTALDELKKSLLHKAFSGEL